MTGLGLPALRDCALEGVRVAWVDLDQLPRSAADLESCLSPEERERARRFRFEHDRRRFVVARAVLRGLLANALDLAPSGVEIVADRLGKPRLAPGTSDLAFNLSHTQGRALYALASAVQLGVDAEQVRPLADMETLARDVFSPSELAEWRPLPEPQRTAGFFNGWTRKEAFVKALGRGLDYPLADFDVSLSPGRAARLLRVTGEAAPLSRWSIESLSPEAGYTAAIVVGREPQPRSR